MDKDKLSTQSLVFGILSLALTEIGLLGVIFGAIGKSKAKAYAASCGEPSGQVKAGSIMSKIGFIVGIVMTVIWVLDIILVIAGNM